MEVKLLRQRACIVCCVAQGQRAEGEMTHKKSRQEFWSYQGLLELTFDWILCMSVSRYHTDVPM